MLEADGSPPFWIPLATVAVLDKPKSSRVLLDVWFKEGLKNFDIVVELDIEGKGAAGLLDIVDELIVSVTMTVARLAERED